MEEPFTLGWWIDNLRECSFRKESINIERTYKGKHHGIMVESDKLAIRYQKYDRIEEWIVDRIIDEYGENK